MEREIIFFGDNVIDFYKSQDSKVQLKIEYVLDLVRFERQVPIKFFKKTQKTPKNEIRLAEFLKTEYLKQKEDEKR